MPQVRAVFIFTIVKLHDRKLPEGNALINQANEA